MKPQQNRSDVVESTRDLCPLKHIQRALFFVIINSNEIHKKKQHRPELKVRRLSMTQFFFFGVGRGGFYVYYHCTICHDSFIWLR